MGVDRVFLHDNVEMALPNLKGLEVLADFHRLHNRNGVKRVGRLPALLDIQMEMGIGYGYGKSILLELRSVHAIYSDKPVSDFGREKAVRGHKGEKEKRIKYAKSNF